MKLILNLLFTVIFISLSAFSVLCNKYGVKKIWLFSKTNFKGIVRVDENGEKEKGFSLSSFMYVEATKDSEATWDSVKINNKNYALQTSLVKEATVNVGKAASDEKSITIKPKSSNNLWLLTIENIDVELPNDEVSFTLLGNENGKRIAYEVTKTNTKLLSEMRP